MLLSLHYKIDSKFRRTPLKRIKANACASTRKSPKKKHPGVTCTPIPSPGEDSVSFQRHNLMLKVEFKKSRRNSQVVSDLMERKAILEEPQSLESIFHFYKKVNRYLCLC